MGHLWWKLSLPSIHLDYYSAVVVVEGGGLLNTVVKKVKFYHYRSFKFKIKNTK